MAAPPFVAFIDESGDHGLSNIDPQFPCFVLSLCLCRSSEYVAQVVPAFIDFKLQHFRHEAVVLHSHSIRKANGDFAFLTDPARRAQFLGDLDRLIASVPFLTIASAIDKRCLNSAYSQPASPYDLALEFCLERLYLDMNQRGLARERLYVLVECRGAKEDIQLEAVFRRICAGNNACGTPFPFEPVFCSKKLSSAGLQLADLVAYPVARHVINPNQPSAAWPTVEAKLRRSQSGQVRGWGLKVFP